MNRQGESKRRRNRRPKGHNRAIHGVARSEHILQLFDTDESLSKTVGDFVFDGITGGQRALVVATPDHWAQIADALIVLGCDPDAAEAAGHLVVRDAVEMLSRFMRRGEPNRALFEESVAATVRRLQAESPSGLRIYGEMVEVLAEDGNYTGASLLEDFWNDLAADCSFTLLCGYSAAHFAGPDAGHALGVICRQHSRSITKGDDPLGRFLLQTQQAKSTPLHATR